MLVTGLYLIWTVSTAYLVFIGVAREAEEAIAPKMPTNTCSTKKCAKFLYFAAQSTCSGRLYSGQSGARSVPVA